jgi:hypothetical protein
MRLKVKALQVIIFLNEERVKMWENIPPPGKNSGENSST